MNKGKYFAIFLVFLLAVFSLYFLFSSRNSTTINLNDLDISNTKPADLSTLNNHFNDSRTLLNFKYPSSWTKPIFNSDNSLFTYPTAEMTSDGPNTYLTLDYVKDSYGGPISLCNTLKTNSKPATVSNEVSFKLKDVQAEGCSFEILQTIDGQELKSLVIVIPGITTTDHLFDIRYQSTKGKYSNYLPLALGIIKSIEIKPSPAASFNLNVWFRNKQY